MTSSSSLRVSACALAACLVAAALCGAQPPPRTPAELGSVAWLRNFDLAARLAEQSGKPLLVLFQEVPGCTTCVKYGTRVLSHPLIVEAAEYHFVPVAVFNNLGDDDARVLELFGEPSWNNPVVRIVTPQRQPLVPRLAGDYSVGGLAGAMVRAIEQRGAAAPTYLQLVAEEGSARAAGVATALLEMHCFWDGEVKLGRIPGVVATRPGFIGSEEVVEVEFDPRRLSFAELVGKARELQCARKVFVRDPQQHRAASAVAPDATVRTTEPVKLDKQPKYYLFNTPYKHVPMTPLQALRINEAIFSRRDPDTFLSPRQLEILAAVKRAPDAGWLVGIAPRNLPLVWARAEALRRKVEAGQKRGQPPFSATSEKGG